MPSVEVLQTAEFEEWFRGLSDEKREDVAVVVGLLRHEGIALGFPHSSALRGSKFALRELRPNSGSSPIRVVYAFDPNRHAVVILGGDKGSDKKFYKRIIKKAEDLWIAHLDYVAELKAREKKARKEK